MEWAKIRPLAEGIMEMLEELQAQLMAFLESIAIDPERSAP